MPPPARKVSGGRQATLSFNHRVTKPSATKQSAKEAALPTKTVEPEDKKAKAEEDKEKVKAEPEKAEKDDLMAEIQAEEEDEEAQAKEEAPKADEKPLLAASRSEDEIAADAVTDAQIRRYWRSVEVQSMARRVHQEGLDLGEKVLRYFDVSSHFGVSWPFSFSSFSAVRCVRCVADF